MAKQQSDHIDNRFRQAAENVSVPPNPAAWEKMEQLLDSEDRRRPVAVWWYLPFLCVILGAAVFTYQWTKKLGEAPSVASPVPSKSSASQKPFDCREQEQGSSKATAPLPVGKEKSATTGQETPANLASKFKGASDLTITSPSSAKKKSFEKSTSKPADQGSSVSGKVIRNQQGRQLPVDLQVTGIKGKAVYSYLQGRSAFIASKQAENERTTNKADLKNRGTKIMSRPAQDEPLSTGSNAQQTIVEAKDSTAAEISRAKQEARDSLSEDKKDKPQIDSATPAPVKLKAASNKWKLERGISLSVIGKFDATNLHHISLHKFKPIFGAGLGYRLSNRFTLQTGIFVQRAIYFAGPEDYTVKPGTYLSMYKISKIDANCLFYEIPLTVRYDYLIGKSIRFYATAGFNSYIMKNEAYRYHATGSAGYRMFDSTYTTNKNIFASANFSAGVEKKITPSFSVQLEPYVTLPNSGLGAGKVKLYSSGLQLSLKFQPVKSTSTRNK